MIIENVVVCFIVAEASVWLYRGLAQTDVTFLTHLLTGNGDFRLCFGLLRIDSATIPLIAKSSFYTLHKNTVFSALGLLNIILCLKLHDTQVLLCIKFTEYVIFI